MSVKTPPFQNKSSIVVLRARGKYFFINMGRSGTVKGPVWPTGHRSATACTVWCELYICRESHLDTSNHMNIEHMNRNQSSLIDFLSNQSEDINMGSAFCYLHHWVLGFCHSLFSSALMEGWSVCCRQRKDELEQRMSSLQESRRELMVQLEGLMKLLKVTITQKTCSAQCVALTHAGGEGFPPSRLLYPCSNKPHSPLCCFLLNHFTLWSSNFTWRLLFLPSPYHLFPPAHVVLLQDEEQRQAVSLSPNVGPVASYSNVNLTLWTFW